MTSIRKLALALCLVGCFSALPSKAQTPVTTQTHSISDDGYANVPLQFDFPYYGQTFNNSWMFSNGIVSFREPQQSGLANYNLSVQPMSSTMGSQFDYSIFPLWSDLINLSGTFKTEGSTQFQRYSWIGISPFADANRLNTFSVEITPDGKVVTNYSLLNIDYGQVGLTGKTSDGEFESIASLGRTNSLPGWDRIPQAALPPPPPEPQPDPCVSDPLSSSSCPRYAQALLASLPATTTTTSTETVPDTTTVVNSEPVQTTPAPTIVAQPATQAPVEIAPVATVSSAPAQTTETQSSGGSRVSLSTILSIVATEQSRIANVERSVVEASVEQANKEAEKTTQQAESIASAAVTESVSISISSSQTQTQAEQQAIASSATTESSGGGLSFFSVTSLSVSPSDSSIGFKAPEISVATTAIEQENKIEQSSINFEDAFVAPQVANAIEEVKPESAVSFSGFSAVNVLKEETNVSVNEIQQEQKTETVKRNVPNNELAGGVTLASLATQPRGFEVYSIAMPDNAFYAPKEIYRNQKVIDNPAGRRLFGGSDSLHEKMVDQQYIGR
jgi:hypothetical protein